MEQTCGSQQRSFLMVVRRDDGGEKKSQGARKVMIRI
jgi:hypothetical protein